MTTRNELPPPGAANFSQRVRETLMTYLGRQGESLDRGLTIRDLIENNILKLGSSWTPSSAIPSLEIGTAISASYVEDLTPPPTPSGFALTAAISHIFIETSAAIYTQGNGHKQTHIYGTKYTAGQPLPTFSNAIELGRFQGNTWALPSDPSTTWRLWAKWETVDGVLSNDPAGGTNGLEAKTGQDVALLLTALNGSIKQDQLYSALSTKINLITDASSVPGSVSARVESEKTERVTATSALSSQINVLQSAVNGNTSAISQEASTRANADGELFAQWTVKTDQNGYVSGFGLASTLKNGIPSSSFAVRADRFLIASPTGPGITPATPFIVQTTPTVIGGISVPAGVYIQDAFIKNGTITNAKIANAAIDSAKIINLSANKITSGSISVGEIIKSSNFISGSSGWSIGGNGVAEFSSIVARGAIYSSEGLIGSIRITSSGLESTNYAAGSTGFKIFSSGTVDIVNGNFSGTLNVKSGSSGERLEITNSTIKVFDSNNVVRVRIGNLS